jgi:soluble lytic murein transglycosylase
MSKKVRISICLGLAGAAGMLVLKASMALVNQTPVMPSVNHPARVEHAKELFGPYYRDSVVRRAEYMGGIEKFIAEQVFKGLPGPWKPQSQIIANIIIDQANQAGLDPMFVLALITRESRLNPDARGRHGEIGLMQLKPDTAEWIARKAGLPWQGPVTLKDPAANIRLGLAYLGMLRARYDKHSRFYITAYNMGPANLNRLVKAEVRPFYYAGAVMGIYSQLYGDLVKETMVRVQAGSQVRLAAVN